MFTNALKKPYFLMFMGIALSFCCSSLVNGAIPSFVSMGLLSTSWIPILTTVSGILSAMGLVIARLIENRNPYRIIMACNLYDTLLSLIAIIVVTQHLFSTQGVLYSYLILISITPVVASISQQIYSGELSLTSSADSSFFNTLAFSYTPFMSLALSATAGSLLAGTSLTSIIAVNVVLSIISFIFSFNAYRLSHRAHRSHITSSCANEMKRESQAPSMTSPIKWMKEHRWNDVFNDHSLRDIFSISAHSPFTIGLLYFTLDIYLLYLPVWLSEHSSHKSHVVALINFCSGIGSACGPIFYHRFRLKAPFKSHVLFSITCIAGAECIMLASIMLLHHVNDAVIGLCAFMVLIISFMGSYSSMASIGARQSAFATDRYNLIVGLSYSCLSIAIIAGSWVGYYLSAAQHPATSLAVSLILGLILLFAIKRHTSPTRSVITD